MRRYKWMLPVKQSNLTNVDWIHPKAKYHCFFKNTSLCEKYWQDQDFFTTDIDTEEIEKIQVWLVRNVTSYGKILN